MRRPRIAPRADSQACLDSPSGRVHSLLLLAALLAASAFGDDRSAPLALERVRSSGKLLYGSDMEGGGPYAYPDPKSPRDVTGFEVELMALLGKELGVDPGLLPGPVGQAAPGPGLRPDRPGGQRLRVDRGCTPATTWRPVPTTSISSS